MSTKTELLPCPFCASENIGVGASQDMDDAGNYIEEGRQWTVLCNGCGASSSLYSHSEGEAIAAWNTRAPAQCTLASNATTISCSGKDITIACDDHDTKQAVMDALTGDGEPVAYLRDIAHAHGVATVIADADDYSAYPVYRVAPLADEAGVREALQLGLETVTESFEHASTYDDQLLAEARHRSISTALRPSQAAAVLPTTYTEICLNEKCPRGGQPVEIVTGATPPTASADAVREAVLTELRNASGKFRLEEGDRYSMSMRHANSLVSACRIAADAMLALARPPELENEKLRKALKPFAEAASNFTCTIGPDGIDDGVTVAARLHGRPEREATLSSADFSRAARALRREG